MRKKVGQVVPLGEHKSWKLAQEQINQLAAELYDVKAQIEDEKQKPPQRRQEGSLTVLAREYLGEAETAKPQNDLEFLENQKRILERALELKQQDCNSLSSEICRVECGKVLPEHHRLLRELRDAFESFLQAANEESSFRSALVRAGYRFYSPIRGDLEPPHFRRIALAAEPWLKQIEGELNR